MALDLHPADVATSKSSGAAGSLAVSMPANYVSGDLVLIGIASSFDQGFKTPTGWAASATVGDGFGGNRLATFYKEADGSEGATVSISLSSGTAAITAEAVRISGHDSAAPINKSATNSKTSGSTTAITSPAVTPDVGGTAVVRFVATRESTGIAVPSGQTDLGTAATGTAHSDNTSRATYASGPASGVSSGTVTFVGTGGGREWVAVTLAVAPGTSPPPPPPPPSGLPENYGITM